MKKRLVFIGGPPGVGKSTVAKILLNELEDCAWLDGDDVWRMSPFIVNTKTKTMVENNIKFVLNSFLSAHYSNILFTWVLHSNSIVDTLISELDKAEFELLHFSLVCDETALTDRIKSDHGRATDIPLALGRLRKVQSVNSEQIDTTGKSPNHIANLLKNRIIS